MCQVGLNLDAEQVNTFIKARMGKVIDMDGCVGAINTFIVEPFVPHDQEFYLCLQTQRLGTDISFSPAGGIEIEANWDKVKKVTIPTFEEANGALLSPLLVNLPLELREKLVAFIQGCFKVSSNIISASEEIPEVTIASHFLPILVQGTPVYVHKQEPIDGHNLLEVCKSSSQRLTASEHHQKQLLFKILSQFK